MQLRIEYDRDGDLINASLWENGTGFMLSNFNSNMREIVANDTPIESGRWDGEASTNLCHEYHGRPCTSGGTFEIYEVSL